MQRFDCANAKHLMMKKKKSQGNVWSVIIGWTANKQISLVKYVVFNTSMFVGTLKSVKG